MEYTQIQIWQMSIKYKAHVFRQPKVGKLDNPRWINEQICSFNVPVWNKHLSHQNFISTLTKKKPYPDFHDHLWTVFVLCK